MLDSLLSRYHQAGSGARLGSILAVGVLIGFLLLPMLIYVAGISLLGRYEGGSLGHLYGSVYRGLGQGNLASWIVVLGPALLYLLGRLLWSWWRRGSV